jgi:hypothetical protein
MRSSVLVALLLSLPGIAGAWPIYVAAEIGGAHRVLALDADLSVSELTTSDSRITDMAVAEDGSLLLGRSDGLLVRWDVDSLTATTVASGFSRIESIVLVEDGIIVTDAWRGVFRVTSAAIDPLYEDPLPGSFRYRYEGASVLGAGPASGDVFVARRPFACFSEPSVLMRFDSPRGVGASPSFSDMSFETRDMAGLGDRLVLTDWECAGNEDLRILDPATMSGEHFVLPPYLGTVVRLGVNEGDQIVRAASGTSSGADALVIDSVDPSSGERTFLLGLYGQLEGLAVDGRSALQRLPCSDDQRTHGDYVSCVSHVTKEMVRRGEMDDRARAAMIVEAARSAIGK